MSRAANQYTPVSPTEIVNTLLTTRCERVEKGMFTCFVPKGKGTYENESGYIRINFNGRKVLAHVLVFETRNGFSPDERGEEVSHLCDNPGCCNPAHLASETRSINLSRRSCPGYIITPDK